VQSACQPEVALQIGAGAMENRERWVGSSIHGSFILRWELSCGVFDRHLDVHSGPVRLT
jgi:hypothetical protein